MPNRLKNAAFLDGVANWTAIGAASLSVDEATLGAPGRAVLKAAGTGTGVQGVRSAQIAVTAGVSYDALSGWYADAGTSALSVEWWNGGPSPISETAIPLVRAAAGTPKRGLPRRMNQSYGRITAPAGATLASFKLITTLGSSAAYNLLLLKPSLSDLPAYDVPVRWEPGPHDNPDLNLPVWPHDLPPLLREDFNAAPTTRYKAFDSDAMIQGIWKAGDGSRVNLQGRLLLKPEQVDDLQEFRRLNATPFWFVRPDTDELCQAWWAPDGEPKLAAFAVDAAYYAIGLQLAVA